MSRNYTGGRGSMIQRTQYGQPVYSVMALSRYPAPGILTEMQKNIWEAALGDVAVEFFRARHIPMMIQYVRAMEALITLGDKYQEDPEDPENYYRWNQMFAFTARIERHLGLTVRDEVTRIFEARAEMRIANQERAAREGGRDRADGRNGLVYDSPN